MTNYAWFPALLLAISVFSLGCSPRGEENHRDACVQLSEQFMSRFSSGDIDGALSLCRPDGVSKTELQRQYDEWHKFLPSKPRLIQAVSATDFVPVEKGVISPPPAKVEGTDLVVKLEYWWHSDRLIIHAFSLSRNIHQ